MTTEDLKEFFVEIEEPLSRNYFGFDIYTCQPWCQGPYPSNYVAARWL